MDEHTKQAISESLDGLQGSVQSQPPRATSASTAVNTIGIIIGAIFPIIGFIALLHWAFNIDLMPDSDTPLPPDQIAKIECLYDYNKKTKMEATMGPVIVVPHGSGYEVRANARLGSNDASFRCIYEDGEIVSMMIGQ